MKLTIWLRNIALLTLAVLAMAASAHATPTDDLKKLLEQNRAAEAYELGTRHAELLGDPEFDLPFGIAAVDANHAGEGVLALERYVTQFPDNTVARVELARAYFVLGEDARAREEFENALRENPPAQARTTIEGFLEAIRRRESRYRTTSSVFLEAGAGTDSNVNGGVGNANINLPVLGNVTVSADGTRKGDSFASLAAGAQISHPIAPGTALFGSAGIESRQNSTQRSLDMTSTGLTGGISLLRDKELYRISATQNVLDVASSRFRSIDGLNGEWNHQLDELHAIQPAFQFAKFSYAGANAVRDADYASLGITYRQAFIHGWQPVLNLGITSAREHNLKNRADLGRDITGLRIGLNLSPHSRWNLAPGFSYQDSRYNGADPILLATRSDQYLAFDLSASYLIDKTLSLRGEAVLSENRSNLSLYQYTRNVFTLKLRYESR